MTDLRRFSEAAQAAEACGRQILDWLQEAMDQQGLATLAVSGGSSPRLMFQIFAKTPFAWDRVHLFWVDERGVPPADAQSNYRLTAENWLGPGKFPRTNIHRVEAELPPEAAVEGYNGEIRRFFGLRAGELPRFDVIHRGMGPDAHTASLFPGEPLIDNRVDIAAAVRVEKFDQWRVTLLPGVLLAARHTAMLVTGADKAAALRAVLHEPFRPMAYPAQLASGEGTVWFADTAAAADAKDSQ